jgi:hypothetical protein
MPTDLKNISGSSRDRLKSIGPPVLQCALTIPPEWLIELQKRRPKNLAVVAMANKMARKILSACGS